MSFNDGIPKIRSFSLTDLHDFEKCPFRFSVRHILDKKYEIDKGNESMALGNLLDQSIKKFHKAKYYNCDPMDLEGIVRACAREMIEMVEIAKEKNRHQFYETSTPYLTEAIIQEAISLFISYYRTLDQVIAPAIGEVGFCEWIFEVNGANYKLWGGPDTLEMGEDGLPEVVDYKSRKNIDWGKAEMDMDLMPKVYVLLMRQRLLDDGFKKARFIVRFWQDPTDKDFNEVFDLESMESVEHLIKQKVEDIENFKEMRFCEDRFCEACKSEKRGEYLAELARFGIA